MCCHLRHSDLMHGRKNKDNQLRQTIATNNVGSDLHSHIFLYPRFFIFIFYFSLYPPFLFLFFTLPPHPPLFLNAMSAKMFVMPSVHSYPPPLPVLIPANDSPFTPRYAIHQSIYLTFLPAGNGTNRVEFLVKLFRCHTFPPPTIETS